MRARAITYDTGVLPGDRLTRPDFSAENARRDMTVIADELHSAAIRTTGRDPDRIGIAARAAKAAGLEVWLSPLPVDLSPDEVLAMFTDCTRHPENVFVTEFGTCPYRGAGDLGGTVWQVPPDEDEQVRYFTESSDIFDAEAWISPRKVFDATAMG
jgi:hypothetical protein